MESKGELVKAVAQFVHKKLLKLITWSTSGIHELIETGMNTLNSTVILFSEEEISNIKDYLYKKVLSKRETYEYISACKNALKEIKAGKPLLDILEDNPNLYRHIHSLYALRRYLKQQYLDLNF